jgi:hypothetical protein
MVNGDSYHIPPMFDDENAIISQSPRSWLFVHLAYSCVMIFYLYKILVAPYIFSSHDLAFEPDKLPIVMHCGFVGFNLLNITHFGMFSTGVACFANVTACLTLTLVIMYANNRKGLLYYMAMLSVPLWIDLVLYLGWVWRGSHWYCFLAALVAYGYVVDDLFLLGRH